MLILIKTNKLFITFGSLALVAELVDALDSKSSSFGSVGSIPTQGTIIIRNVFVLWVSRFYQKMLKRFKNVKNDIYKEAFL